MNDSRTKNVIRNTKWGMIQKLVNVFCPFVVRTILIHKLGAEYAGLSSLFTSILTVLSLTELGFSNAIVYSMYKPVAEDDVKKIKALLNVYKKTYRIIGIVISVIGVGIIPFLPFLIDGEIPNDINLYYIYLIFLVNTSISYFLFAYKTSLLSAYQRLDVVSKNTLINNLLLYSVQCIVLILFKDYYIYLIILPLTTIVLNILNNSAVNKMYPQICAEGDIDETEKKELKKNVIGLMIWKIGGTTRNTLDSIVISSFLGLVSVAMYNNYFYIINGVNAFLLVISSSMLSGVGNKIATESPEKNYDDFVKFQFYYMWISGWCVVSLACLFQPFMRIWMGEELMFPNHIMFLFCYYFWMLKQGDINSVYYQAAGLWWHGKWRSVVEAILNLILNVLLGYFFGVEGIILATIISYTCIYFYGCKFIFTDYFKNGRLKDFYIDNIIYEICTAGAVAITYFFVNTFFSKLTTFLSIGMSIVFCAIFPNLLFFLIFGMNIKKRIYMKEIYVRLKRLKK